MDVRKLLRQQKAARKETSSSSSPSPALAKRTAVPAATTAAARQQPAVPDVTSLKRRVDARFTSNDPVPNSKKSKSSHPNPKEAAVQGSLPPGFFDAGSSHAAPSEPSGLSSRSPSKHDGVGPEVPAPPVTVSQSDADTSARPLQTEASAKPLPSNFFDRKPAKLAEADEKEAELRLQSELELFQNKIETVVEASNEALDVEDELENEEKDMENEMEQKSLLERISNLRGKLGTVRKTISEKTTVPKRKKKPPIGEEDDDSIGDDDEQNWRSRRFA